jgi:hypothetical protein
MVSIVNILSGALHLMLDVRQTGIIPACELALSIETMVSDVEMLIE